MSRRIEVYSSQTNSTEVVNFTGETFGDLLDQMGIDSGEFTGAGGTTKSTYIDTDAVISPDDDFIAIYPTKMKAGNGTRYSDAVLKELHTKLTNILADVMDIGEEALSEMPSKSTSKSFKEVKNAERAKQLAKSVGIRS